jgi:hypothetical protein
VWEVPQRYTNLSPIGCGAYGQVDCGEIRHVEGMSRIEPDRKSPNLIHSLQKCELCYVYNICTESCTGCFCSLKNRANLNKKFQI